MTSFEQLPYRPCAGLMVLNRQGLAFIGRRVDGPEHVDNNISSVERLGEVAEWLTYDIPRAIVGHAWNGKYRGQTQKWFALRFTGDEREIDIVHPAGGAHEPEFVEWRWERLQNLPDLVVPFKRKIYERVVAEFAKFA